MNKNLALAAIALVFLLGAAFESSNSVPGPLKDIPAQISGLEAHNAYLAAQVASNGPRKFYLTKIDQGVTGAQALSACDTCYHMASFWEIHDLTTLRYDKGRGATSDDSGSGPLSASGWIRTGNQSNGVNLAGTGNCNAWTSANRTDFGTAVALPREWNPASPSTSAVGPWLSLTFACNTAHPVWCVQD